MNKILKLSDSQFNNFEIESRRKMLVRYVVIDTPKYRYELGSKRNLWKMLRYNRESCIAENSWPLGYEGECVDEWDYRD